MNNSVASLDTSATIPLKTKTEVAYSSFQIANFFIRKASETGKQLSPMKLIKLVYLAHGWHLGIVRTPLIHDQIQAWKYGPVIPVLYRQYKDFGSGHIDASALTPVPDIDDEDTKSFLSTIWDTYSKSTGGQLSTLTHEENSPWWTTWNLHGGAERRGAVISNDLIQEHYMELAEDNGGKTAER